MANTQRHTNSRNPLASDGWVLAEAAFALIAAGFLPAPGADNAFYVLIPYAGSVVSCVLAAMAAFHSPVYEVRKLLSELVFAMR